MRNREGPKAGSQSSSLALQMLHVLVKERDGKALFLMAQESTLPRDANLDLSGRVSSQHKLLKTSVSILSGSRCLVWVFLSPSAPRVSGQDGGSI